MFDQASNFVITNSQFFDNPTHPSTNGLHLLLNASLPEATHDSSARWPPPQCFPGTRDQHIREFTTWVFDEHRSSRIIWISGPAGVGKSALAQTCAETIGPDCLAATFFFSCMKPRDDPTRLFTSIAYQVAMACKPFATTLDEKIAHNPSLLSKSIEVQFRELILRPYVELRAQRAPLRDRLVIIDGLDECNGDVAQCTIIRLIAKAVREHGANLPLLWAFFSRPEPHLSRTFSSDTISSLCSVTTLPVSHEINEIYLRGGFQNIGKRYDLSQLESKVFFKPGEEVDLRLKEPGREMVYEGGLQNRNREVQVFLLDHAILFTKSVKNKHDERFRVYRRPVPLELLHITASEDVKDNNDIVRLRNQMGLAKDLQRDSGTIVPTVDLPSETEGRYWINFVYLGRNAYSLVLWADSALSQRAWVESIQRQQQIMRERSMIFDTTTLSKGFFAGSNKVNCAAPFGGGRRVVYGTDDGVYLSDLREPGREPLKVLSLLEISHVDVLEDCQLLIVLSERQVITFPLDALDPSDPLAGLKRSKRVSSHASFFKAGFCLGRVLVCIVNSSQLSSTFKVLEAIDSNIRDRSKPTFKKLLQGGNDTLKPFKEFYIPVESTSVHYLKTKMCVSCLGGFEIIDFESLDAQGLLDPSDESLKFVRKRENIRPMALYRIQNEFLVCYDEFAFYVNKSGRKSRGGFMIYWEGQPTGFALHEPYILAFEPSFIEIRHIETGYLAQVIQGSHLRMLFADTPPSVKGIIGQNTQYQERGYPRSGRDEILACSIDRVFVLRHAGRSSQSVLPGNTLRTSKPQ